MDFKIGFLLFAISYNTLASKNPTPNSDCQTINLNNYTEFINKRKKLMLVNPFNSDQACVPVSYRPFDNNELQLKQYEKKWLADEYEAFLKGPVSKVLMLHTPGSNKTYSFLKFNFKGPMMKLFQRDKIKKRILKRHAKELMFLHEVFHLDPKITLNKNLAQRDKEAISDLAAILTISFKYDFSPHKLKALLSALAIQRKIGDKSHSNRDTYSKLKPLFKYLDDINFKIKNLSFKNTLKLARIIVEKTSAGTITNTEFLEIIKSEIN